MANDHNQWQEPGFGSAVENDCDVYDYESHHEHPFRRVNSYKEQHLNRYLDEGQSQHMLHGNDTTESAEQSRVQHKEKMKKKILAMDKKLKSKKTEKEKPSKQKISNEINQTGSKKTKNKLK